MEDMNKWLEEQIDWHRNKAGYYASLAADPENTDPESVLINLTNAQNYMDYADTLANKLESLKG